MIPVRVGDHDMADAFPRHRALESIDVRVHERPRIDHGDVAAPDDVGSRAVERERARVLGDDAADQGRDLVDRAVFESQVADERNFSRHDPSVHCPRYWWRVRKSYRRRRIIIGTIRSPL